MPSPFPGMDPFLESQAWEDFHTRLIADLSDALVPAVRPRYVVRIEERVYIENESANRSEAIRPDVALLQRPSPEPPSGVAVALAPIMLTLPIPQRERETFLTVRDRSNMEVVTLIELLSPGNKRNGSDGRREYLHKRETVLRSFVHLVELDLLRAGERLPTIEPLPPADYYVFVCRGDRRPRVDVYAWSLRQPLPTIPVPLAGNDPDVFVDLQTIFRSLYDQAGYDYSLDYTRPVQPGFRVEDREWAQQLVSATSHAVPDDQE